MPKNKEALIRYRVINRCLKESRYVSKQKLIRACERALDIAPVSERTIAGDIHAMRYDSGLGYSAPIVFDKYRKAYYYEDPDYSIDQIPLNQDEVSSLLFVATMLDQFKNIEMFERFSGSVQKIIDALNIHRMQEMKNTADFIDFEKVPSFKGSEYLEVLFHAIRDKMPVEIRHQAFYSESEHIHTVHPYLLKEYRNRWYLIGWHDEYREIRKYGLDRLNGIRILQDLKFIERNFSPSDYFRNTIGIFSPAGDPPEIILEIRKNTAFYFLTQPIHESQEVINTGPEKITIRLRVHPTAELIQLIMGWSDEIRVIAPESLKEDIMNQLRNALGLY